MADLPTDSIQRIADARRDAESELKKALSVVAETYDVTPCLSAFKSFACALFDAEARELLLVSDETQEFQASLENEVAPRIIEGILPDRSLDRVARRTDKVKRLSVQHDSDTDLLWEVGPDGARKAARAEAIGVYAQHGDWENFMPKGVRFLLRWPNNSATVRAVLCQALQQRAASWVGQFPNRAVRTTAVPSPSASRAKNCCGDAAKFPKRASWLNDRLRERAWNKNDLERYGGPDHKTVQKILDGLSVREDVLQRVADGLSKRPPEVTVTDIPQD